MPCPKIIQNAVYLDARLNLIPQEMYVAPDHEKTSNQWKSKYMKNKKKTAPKQSIKEASSKGQRNKFNMEHNKSTSHEQNKNKVHNLKDVVGVSGSKSSSDSKPTSLRQRLRVRIETLKSERFRSGDSGPRSKKSTKLKNDKAKSTKHDVTDASKSMASTNVAVAVDSAPRFDREKKQPTKTLSSTSMIFQTFEMDGRQQALRRLNDNKGKRGNLQKLLDKAEKKRKLANELNASDPKKLKDSQWQDMMLRAEGGKVLDDPKRLKKAIKRKERSKRRSTEQWLERSETLKADMAERQEARNRNLQNKRMRGHMRNEASVSAKTPGHADDKPTAGGGRDRASGRPTSGNTKGGGGGSGRGRSKSKAKGSAGHKKRPGFR
eukprot:g3324.t1